MINALSRDQRFGPNIGDEFTLKHNRTTLAFEERLILKFELIV